MKYVYFDASAGLSGDMILAALLDLGVEPAAFKAKMASLKLPVEIRIRETTRASLRGLKVDVAVKKGKGPKERLWGNVRRLIEKSPFSTGVRKRSIAIFKALFEAEARVHGQKFDRVHLHEAAADDAIIDVVGCSFLAEALQVKKFISSPLNVGAGWVKTSHGLLPVPPPAVAELLRNIPIYSAGPKTELVTPTGAAIIATLADEFLSYPELTYEKIGYGAGSRDFPELPNILRAFYGGEKDLRPSTRIYQIESNVDDSNPQILASFIEKALRLGALDAFLTPVVMKKGRLGSQLTVLTDLDKMEKLIDLLFRETSSIGLRYFPVARKILKREIKKLKIFGEEIGVKVSLLGGKAVNIQPEFSDCLRVAEKTALPVKEIVQLVLKEYLKKAEKLAR